MPGCHPEGRSARGPLWVGTTGCVHPQLEGSLAARWNPVLRNFCQHLPAVGKPPRLALTAVARKLLVLLNAMRRDGRRWRYA